MVHRWLKKRKKYAVLVCHKRDLSLGFQEYSAQYIPAKDKGRLPLAISSYRGALLKTLIKEGNNYSAVKSGIKDGLSNFLYRKTMRRPMIIPVIVEVQP